MCYNSFFMEAMTQAHLQYLCGTHYPRHLWEIHFHISTQSQLCHLIDIFICLIGGFSLHLEKEKRLYRDATLQMYFFNHSFITLLFSTCQGCHNTLDTILMKSEYDMFSLHSFSSVRKGELKFVSSITELLHLNITISMMSFMQETLKI